MNRDVYRRTQYGEVHFECKVLSLNQHVLQYFLKHLSEADPELSHCTFVQYLACKLMPCSPVGLDRFGHPSPSL